MTTTTDPLDALLYVRDGQPTARWNFVDAVGSPVGAPAGLGNAVSLSFSFLSVAPSYHPTAGFASFSTAAREATRDVLEMISSVARVSFSEVAGVGTITFGMDEQNGSAGFAYIPSFGYTSSGGIISSVTAQDLAGDVWLDSGAGWTASDFEPGGNGLGTLVHEIGHALGLKHPFEADSPGGYTLDPAFDNKAWTVMSYTEHPHGLFRTVTDNGGGSFSWRYEYVQPETMMPYDIAALQHLYGASKNTRTGNDVYTFDPTRPFIKTIVDAGGTDTISVANFSLGCEIDLRDGHFSSIRIASDALPAGVTETRTNIYDGTDNLAIAFGVVIENATGGSGADLLTGSAAANRLDGGAGADMMIGGAGNDTYIVDSSADVIVEVGGGGSDAVSSTVTYTLPVAVERLTLTGSPAIHGTGNTSNNTITGNSNANKLTGGDGNDSLYGGSGNDTLSGGNGNDLLDGGSGNDSMTGGAGNDRYVVNSSGDKVVEASGGGSDSVSASISTTLPNHVEKLTLTGSSALSGTGSPSSNTITGNSAGNRLSGGDGNDSLYGMDGNDTLDGGNGGDLLDGGSGNDSMTGGAGNDRYVVNSSGDKVIEASGGGIDSVSASISTTLPNHVEKLTLTGTSGLQGHGNSLDNIIVGNSGNNLLRGSTGNDTLTGGAGLDTFRFSSALNAGTNVDTITDFNPADDILQLENSVFTKFTSTGVLSASNFRVSSTGNAADSNDHVLYNTTTGQFFYDADGNGAGAKVLFAVLWNLPALTAADIFVT